MLHSYLLVADVSKAYDNIDLDLLDTLVKRSTADPVVLEQWEGEYVDMKCIDINVNGHIIKRTKGIPQGSKLGPLLFNFYTTAVIGEIEDILDMNMYEIYIYADNWIIKTKQIFTNIVFANQVLELLNDTLKSYNLQFDLQDKFITRLDGKQDYSTGKIETWSLETIRKEIKNFNAKAETIRILGWYFTFDKYKISFKGSKLLFNFKQSYFKTWKDAISYWRIYIASKFRYQYEGILKTKLSNLAKIYKRWFILESTNWFQRNLCCLTIPKEFILNLLENKKIQKEKNFIEWWRRLQIQEPDNSIRPELTKLQEIANHLLNNELYAGIYHVIESLEKPNLNVAERFKECKKFNDVNKYNKMVNLLESAYLAIMRKKKLSVEIYEDLEIYANKRYSTKTRRNFKLKVLTNFDS